MKQILCLGSEGYIGSALVNHLEKDDILISTVDIKDPDLQVDYNELRSHEIRDYDAIILLAGLSSVQQCKSYKITFEENVNKFVNLVWKLQREDYKGKFIF